MKKLVTIALLVIVSIFCSRISLARRGNPSVYTTSNAAFQYYVVDSDDDDPRTPTYKFVDTLYNQGQWTRITGFSDNDDGAKLFPDPGTSTYFEFYNSFAEWQPVRALGVNGLMTLDTFNYYPETAHNTTFPIGTINPNFLSVIAPLWGDMEFRTAGDSSKVFMRQTTDTLYVTYYNLFLKGTNGQVRSTFQAVFARPDSSITFYYKSFDGNWKGFTAAQMFQKLCTIGVGNTNRSWGTNYLDRGVYYAKTQTSQIYAQPLHNSLAVKFLRVIPNFLHAKSIDFPSFDRYEIATNQFQPQVTVENLTGSNRMAYVQNRITNLATGAPVYSRTDSFLVGFNSSTSYTGTAFQGLSCGTYRLTMICSFPSIVNGDGWTPDNTLTRDFVVMNSNTPPFFDDFVKLDPCNWHYDGASALDNTTGFIDPESPVATGSIVLNRRDILGNTYIQDNAGDSITSAPINLQGKSNAWICFSYQRAAKMDTTIAGVMTRTIVGPEAAVVDSNGNLSRAGDTLAIDVLASTGTKWNPSAASWTQIAAIPGGIDASTKKFRVQIPSDYIHDHTRVRLRLLGKNTTPIAIVTPGVPPPDDDDNWLIDGFEVNAASGGQVDLEPYDMNLGNGYFTHVPRSIKFVTPRVTVSNNGTVANLATYGTHLVVKDALNRAVYDRVQSLYNPPQHGDTTISYPQWGIEGSQGGVFTSRVQMEQNFNEIRRQNDTITLYRTLFIDDKYAYDDGVADTAGSMTEADSHFFLDFKPMVSDSIRGFDFYHLDATGTTNWAVTFRNLTGTTLATRVFSYNTLQRGFMRGTITPFYLNADSTYRIEFNMTQGHGLGGDAAKGLVWLSKIDQGPTKKYTALYPNLLSLFRDANGTQYITSDGTARNGAGGGPLLPMVRLVFTGSAQFLPVELASFDARRTSNGEVSLAFRTAKEENAREFNVERETENGWVSVGTVAAHNAQLGANYALVDNNAPFTRVNYRLSETDLDGTNRISGYAAASPFAATEALSVTVSPNPVVDHIHAQLSGVTEPATIKIYDALGKVVLSTSAASNGTLDLDASQLAAGKYTLDVTSAAAQARTAIIVTK